VLDGELARLQGRAGVRGMLLDAMSDRLGEAAVYCGIAYRLDATGHSAVWAVVAWVILVVSIRISLSLSHG
jgi:phosphatidylglycerophosphate synthase